MFRPVLASVSCLLAIVASAAQTRLEILRPNQTSFEFRWLGSSVGVTLEIADALSAPTNWQAVAQTPQLLNGKYSVTLPAETGSRFFLLRSTVIPLTTIESLSPTNGETEVSVSRQIIVRLTGPLSGDALSSDGIYAEHGGVRLDTSIELSEDRRTVTLSFLSNLPSLARINVIVDGFILRDTNDRMVDANANGVPGGIRAVTFRTIGVTVPDDDGDGIDNVSEIALANGAVGGTVGRQGSLNTGGTKSGGSAKQLLALGHNSAETALRHFPITELGG